MARISGQLSNFSDSRGSFVMDLASLVSHAGFYPLKSLKGKKNLKITYRVAPDGSVTEAVSLAVCDKHHREEIICSHFLSHLVRWNIREQIGVTFTSRDNPWDFGIELSNGDKFSLEITSIAEDTGQFVKRASEAGLRKVSQVAAIPLSLVRKLSRNIDSDRAKKVIADADARQLSANTMVQNPWQTDGPHLFVERAPDVECSLYELLSSAIAAKTDKSHEGKESTVLVVDNRTSAYDLGDFHEASQRFEELRATCSFKEVWFYTGYYSDDDGNNSEWSFCPILETDQSRARRKAIMQELGLKANEAGIIHGGF